MALEWQRHSRVVVLPTGALELLSLSASRIYLARSHWYCISSGTWHVPEMQTIADDGDVRTAVAYAAHVNQCCTRTLRVVQSIFFSCHMSHIQSQFGYRMCHRRRRQMQRSIANPKGLAVSALWTATETKIDKIKTGLKVGCAQYNVHICNHKTKSYRASNGRIFFFRMEEYGAR